MNVKKAFPFLPMEILVPISSESFCNRIFLGRILYAYPVSSSLRECYFHKELNSLEIMFCDKKEEKIGLAVHNSAFFISFSVVCLHKGSLLNQ